jgi:hypothetical protein
MTVTDAQFSGLSGEVAALDDRVFDNEKLILGLPDKSDYDAQQTYTSQQFNTINTALDAVIETQNTLVQYVANLKQTITDHVNEEVYALSGLATSGAHS